MLTYETEDQKEVRRFRIAQFNGRTATVKIGSSTVTGFVRSVREKQSSNPPRWTITIIPMEPRERRRPLQRALRATSLADESA